MPVVLIPGGSQLIPQLDVGPEAVDAARIVADAAAAELGLATSVRVLFFKPGPPAARASVELRLLAVGLYDAGMTGKACHPARVRPLTVWIRSGMLPAATAVVAAHEVRHLWQDLDEPNRPSSEDDANAFGLSVARRFGFDEAEWAGMLRELGFQDESK